MLRLADNCSLGLIEIVVEDDGAGLPPEAWDIGSRRGLLFRASPQPWWYRGAGDLIDMASHDAMRAFRSPFVEVHELGFYAPLCWPCGRSRFHRDS